MEHWYIEGQCPHDICGIIKGKLICHDCFEVLDNGK